MYLAMAVDQLIGNIRVYAEFWVREEFCVRKHQDIFYKFVVPSTKETQFSVNGNWFGKYVSDAFEKMSDGFVAQGLESNETVMLGKPTVFISLE